MTRALDVDFGAALLRARHRYELLRLLLISLLVFIVLASLVLGLLQGRRLERLALDNKAQAVQIALILKQQHDSDVSAEASRQRYVAVLIAEQRRALVAHDSTLKQYLAVHDRNVRVYLSQIKALSQVEVYGAGNRENQPVKTVVTTKFIGPIPVGTTRTTVTQPAPAPTCTRTGRTHCR